MEIVTSWMKQGIQQKDYKREEKAVSVLRQVSVVSVQFPSLQELLKDWGEALWDFEQEADSADWLDGQKIA